jgi:ribosomal protein S17
MRLKNRSWKPEEEKVPVDIDKLTEPELIDLNHRIVQRLRFLQQMRAHMAMLAFKIGDRVMFQNDRRQTVEGVIIRYNQKTVTVISDCGHKWTVSPGLLREPVSSQAQADIKSVIRPLKA